MDKMAKKFAEENKQHYQQIYRDAETKRKEFVKKFPIGNIPNMSLERYVVGNGNGDFFCYQLEFGLTEYGELRGQSGSEKYGVYLSKDGTYTHTKKYGTNLQEAFVQVKTNITALLKAGEEKNYEEIQKNKIADTVKAKILAAYYPDIYLPILNPNHITYFLNCCNLDAESIKNNEEKKQLLLKFKNNNPIMKTWNNLMFVAFLYQEYDPRFVVEEEHLETMANSLTDNTAGYEIYKKTVKERKLDVKIIKKLKEKYNGCCQICGKRFFDKYGVSVVEAHHIEYFSKSQNNNADNIVILCPNHHRIIHKLNPKFDKENLCFQYKNGLEEHIKINKHLRKKI